MHYKERDNQEGTFLALEAIVVPKISTGFTSYCCQKDCLDLLRYNTHSQEENEIGSIGSKVAARYPIAGSAVPEHLDTVLPKESHF